MVKQVASLLSLQEGYADEIADVALEVAEPDVDAAMLQEMKNILWTEEKLLSWPFHPPRNSLNG